MISASLQQRKTRTRRSMLFVPGANAAMVSNSFIYPADALMFDLEDSVALREKDTARRMVYHALQHPLYRDIETIVRVNALDSEWGVNDLEAVVRGGADVVRLPKTDTAQDVLDIEKEILRIEKACVVNPAAPACWRRLNLRWDYPRSGNRSRFRAFDRYRPRCRRLCAQPAYRTLPGRN
ncbi:citrate lyase subunit beta [Escherichia coli]|nr:citrate lyase subunit beta [Escherichia coli]